MRVAVIGAGISGVAAARVLVAAGHEVVVFEGHREVGGVWARTYPGTRLQNMAEQYRLGDLPWPQPPDQHPTREQITRYIAAAIRHFGLDVRCEHRVLSMVEEGEGWALTVATPAGEVREWFGYVVVASGHYSEQLLKIDLPGQAEFAGTVLTERELTDLEVLAGKRVVVVGFGKSAVDVAAFAAARGSQVHHVFRAARWLFPRRFLGVHSVGLLFARATTAMIPSWVHPDGREQVLHGKFKPLVDGFWKFIAAITRLQCGLHGFWRDPEVRRRMRVLLPETSVPYQMRSALALAPDAYFPNVVEGRIEPVRGELAGFTRDGVRLVDGREIGCDLVVASIGSPPPRFPFLPDACRALLEGEADGAQLYRHILHPRISRLAFAGFNHGFLHVPGVEVSMLWLSALLRGDLVLPAVAEMEASSAAVRAWKREHMLFEPSRSCGVNTRFHQYLDVLLADLGLRAHRKANALLELTSPYMAGDYAGLIAEYERVRLTLRLPRTPLPVAT